jgi:hypothetical protein
MFLFPQGVPTETITIFHRHRPLNTHPAIGLISPGDTNFLHEGGCIEKNSLSRQKLPNRTLFPSLGI